MTHRSLVRLTPLVLASCAVLGLAGCGGTKTTEPAPAAVAQAPAAAPSEPPAAAPSTAPPAVEATPAAPAAATPAAPKPASKPAPKPAPSESASGAPAKSEPPPKPAPVTKTIAAGTDLDAELIDAASSATSKVGDPVRARVTKPLLIDGLTAVPVGSVISGTITEAVPLKKIGGAASLGIKFDALELPDGTRIPVAAGIHQQGKSETGKDAGTIAGATAGGALLGRLLSKHDKTKGTLIGAAVGAAAGTGAAAATKGQEVELPAGTPLALHLEAPAQVTIQP